MKKLIKDYFTFNSRDQRGLMVLLLLLLLLTAIRWYGNKVQPFTAGWNEVDFQQLPVLPEQSESEVHKMAAFKENETHGQRFKPYRDVAKTRTVIRKPFNPNVADLDTWMSFGLSEKQAAGVMRYLKKHPAENSEDMRSIKLISPYVYDRIKDKLIFPETSIRTAIPEKAELKDTIREIPAYVKKEEVLQLDANTCTAWNLFRNGLCDSVMAGRIIAYRKALGGYVGVHQLKEVNGMETAVFDRLANHLVVDPGSIRLININKAGSYELKKHPYLSYSVALALVNYRAVHGRFEKLSDLKKCMAMNDELFAKITPYLKLEE